MAATRAANVARDVSQDRKRAKSGLSVSTLMIASLSSLAAAVVVSHLWGAGTLIGAAMTPVIVALVSEGLNRPAKVVSTVRQTRPGRYDPVAEGRAGLRDGDFEHARTPPVPAAAAAQIRVHRAAPAKRGFSLRMPRPRVLAAIGTGLVAFLIAAVFLTSSELVLGKSVTSSSKRTTLVPVRRSTSSTKSKDKTDTTKTTDTTTTTSPTTSTATTPTTQSTPTTGQTAPQAVPPAQQTAPAVPPPATTGPAAPPTTTAPPSATPQTTTP
jgi:hypothetical protein